MSSKLTHGFCSYRFGLIAGFAMVALIFLGLIIAASLTVRQFQLAETDVRRSFETLRLVSSAQACSLRVRVHVRGYVISGEEAIAAEAKREALHLSQLLTELRQQAVWSPPQLDRLERLLREGQGYLEYVMALRQASPAEALKFVPGPRGDQLASQSAAELGAIEQEALARLQEAMSVTRQSAERLKWLVLVSAVAITSMLVTACLMVLRELNERRRLMERLERARDAALTLARKRTDFLANMSHEIRTPMNGIIGTSDLLLQTPLNRDQRELAETIRYSADALLAIVNDILDFSKIEAGKMAIDASDFELRTLVEQAVETVAATAARKSLEIVTLVYRDVPEQARGDAGRLRQVLLNLISNAVKFTDKGEIVIRVTKLDETESGVTLRFSVTDTGIGVPKEAQADIFEAFTQADASRSRRFSGTGLGLAISKRLVSLMGGEIGVESEPGKGATFWFTIELEKAGTGQPPSTYELWFGIRVLVLDDNATNRTVIAQQLTDFGLFCEVVADAQEAMAALREAAASGNPYRVAFLDLQMPTMDGLSLLRQIRADKQFAELSCILLATPPAPSAAELARMGASACVTKPVRVSALKDSLRLALGKHKPERATPSSTPLPPREALPEAAPEANGKLILLVEDNVINQQVAERMLESLGYRVVIAANGREALALAEAQPLDAILMDCHLPEMDGYAATRRIREQERAAGRRRVPIVAVTANALSGERERCLSVGMDDYLAKPFKLAELDSLMQRLFCRGAGGSQRPSAEAEPDPPLLDLTIFRVGTGIGASGAGAAEFARQIIATFLQDVAAQLRQMRVASELQDGAMMRALAHRLYGSAAQLGALRLAQALRRIEKATDAADGLCQLQAAEEIFDATRSAFAEGLPQSLWETLDERDESKAASELPSASASLAQGGPLPKRA